jgi:hypothetical protein
MNHNWLGKDAGVIAVVCKSVVQAACMRLSFMSWSMLQWYAMHVVMQTQKHLY